MTTQNTQGTLTNRIILSAGHDPTKTQGNAANSENPMAANIDASTSKAAPNHWQDTVPDGIMNRTLGECRRVVTSLTP